MILLILIRNLFLALSYTLSKFIITDVDPVWYLAASMFVGGLFFIAWHSTSKKTTFTLTPYYIAALIVLGFLSVYLTNLCQLWSLKTLSSAKVSLLFNANPFIIMILGFFFLGEKLSTKKVLGFLCGWLGLYVSRMNATSYDLSMGFSYGEFALIIAIIATVISALILQKTVHHMPHHITFTTGLSMLIGAVFALAHGLLNHHQTWLPHTISYPIILAMIATTIATVICSGLYSYLLKFYPASFVSFTGFMAPLFAAGFDWLIFGSLVSWHFFGAMFLISLGLYMVYKEDSSIQQP